MKERHNYFLRVLAVSILIILVILTVIFVSGLMQYSDMQEAEKQTEIEKLNGTRDSLLKEVEKTDTIIDSLTNIINNNKKRYEISKQQADKIKYKYHTERSVSDNLPIDERVRIFAEFIHTAEL